MTALAAPADKTGMTHKEMTAHIRGRLKHEGIPARCRLLDVCGMLSIQVFGKTYETKFTREQGFLIGRIARVNGLTFVRGLPVTEEHCANVAPGAHYDFYFWGQK